MTAVKWVAVWWRISLVFGCRSVQVQALRLVICQPRHRDRHWQCQLQHRATQLLLPLLQAKVRSIGCEFPLLTVKAVFRTIESHRCGQPGSKHRGPLFARRDWNLCFLRNSCTYPPRVPNPQTASHSADKALCSRQERSCASSCIK